MEVLFNDYKNLINTIAYKIYINYRKYSIEINIKDLKSEAYFIFLKIIKNYDDEKETTIKTYLITYINFYLKNYLRDYFYKNKNVTKSNKIELSNNDEYYFDDDKSNYENIENVNKIIDIIKKETFDELSKK